MLLVGGVVTSRLVAPGLVAVRGRRLVMVGLVLGALLLAGAALLEVAVTLKGVLGRFDPDLFRRYLSTTRHGELARIRLVVTPALALVAVALNWPGLLRGAGARSARAARVVGDLVLLVLCAELLYTFGLLSHAAAMGGAAPLWADLIHLGVAALWAGPVIYLAAIGGLEPAPDSPGSLLPAAQRALTRVSRIGAMAVTVLVLTGAYTALTHASDPAGFARSTYGIALWVKLALFGLVLFVAARNRFALLPRFLTRADGRPLLASLRLEAALLLALFVVTGALTTSPVPHDHQGSTDPFVNLGRMIEQLTTYIDR